MSLKRNNTASPLQSLKSSGIVILWLCLILLSACGQKDPSVTGPLPVGGEVGELAPSVNLEDLDGAGFTLESMRGEILILPVWSETCSECLGATGDLDRIQDLRNLYERQNTGVRVCTLNFIDPVWRMHEIREEGGYTVKFLYDPERTFAGAFEIQELPTVLTFIIDRFGVIRYRKPRVDRESIQEAIANIPD